MTKEIQLTQGKVALVDDENYKYINQWKWYFHAGYAVRQMRINGKSKMVLMHRVILNTPDDMFSDHINHNRLDNRNINIRICSHEQNIHNRLVQKNNTSGKKGVDWKKNMGKWRARIRYQNKRIELGYFDNVDDAAEIYNYKAKELFGEFANGG